MMTQVFKELHSYSRVSRCAAILYYLTGICIGGEGFFKTPIRDENHAVIFKDRAGAGEKLAQVVADLTLIAPLILALPRGGVPVGTAIADTLNCRLDVIRA